MAYLVSPIEGLQQSARRGIAFLESATDGSIDSKQAFDGLNEKSKRDMRGRFDLWLSGDRCDKYFHGWPNDKDRKECFVFKRQRDRFYGLLCNPRPVTDPRFQVCVLVSHAQKNTEHTDPSELNVVNALRAKLEVIAAVKKAYPGG